MSDLVKKWLKSNPGIVILECEVNQGVINFNNTGGLVPVKKLDGLVKCVRKKMIKEFVNEWNISKGKHFDRFIKLLERELDK